MQHFGLSSLSFLRSKSCQFIFHLGVCAGKIWIVDMGVQRNCKRNLVDLHRGMRSTFSAEQFNNEVLTGLEGFVTEKRCCE